MKQMKPLNKYIAVDIIEEEITTDSGLILSDKDKDSLRYRKAVVIEPGTEVTTLSKGDTISYSTSSRHISLYV